MVIFLYKSKDYVNNKCISGTYIPCYILTYSWVDSNALANSNHKKRANWSVFKYKQLLSQYSQGIILSSWLNGKKLPRLISLMWKKCVSYLLWDHTCIYLVWKATLPRFYKFYKKKFIKMRLKSDEIKIRLPYTQKVFISINFRHFRYLR